MCGEYPFVVKETHDTLSGSGPFVGYLDRGMLSRESEWLMYQVLCEQGGGAYDRRRGPQRYA